MEEIIVAQIRYTEEPIELIPLYKEGIRYVLRCGDTKIAYYELDYTDAEELGYAPFGKEIPTSFFDNKNVRFINSKFINQQTKR